MPCCIQTSALIPESSRRSQIEFGTVFTANCPEVNVRFGRFFRNFLLSIWDNVARNPLHADLVACSEYRSGSEVAKTIEVPSQLILARKDRLTPFKAGMAFANELGAKVTVIERYGHMLPIEAPRQTLQKLRELISPLENISRG